MGVLGRCCNAAIPSIIRTALSLVYSVNQEVGNTRSETLVQVHTVPIPSSPTVVCTEVSPSGGLLGACTDDKKVWIWDSEKLELKWER